MRLYTLCSFPLDFLFRKIFSSVELYRTRAFTQKTLETPLIFRHHPLFSEGYELENNSIKSRLGSLLSGCILARAVFLLQGARKYLCTSLLRFLIKETNHL
jgi:hypothetical protein